MHRRRCVACGYDGGQLRDGSAPRCARCGCDLRSRPARSYAEMEGFLLPTPAPQWRPVGESSREQRAIQRWMAFGFLVMLGFLVTLHLLFELVR